MQSLVIAGVNLIENEPTTSKQHKKGTTHQQNNVTTEDELPLEDTELWKPTDVMNLLLDEREENNNNKSSKSMNIVVGSGGGGRTTESVLNKISKENIARSSTHYRRRTTRPSAHSPVALLTGLRSSVVSSSKENEEVFP
jgi:hypothetical protein